jgi:hypothetical protein
MISLFSPLNSKITSSLVVFILLLSCASRKDKLMEGNSVTDKAALDFYDSVKIEYLSKLEKIIEIDTLVQFDRTVFFKLTHYNLRDTFLIPAKFNRSSQRTDFVAHNSASHILITTNTDTLVNRLITKETFDSILPDDLRSYGVLQFPNFRAIDRSKQAFLVQFSVSIPLTDLGRGVELSIDTSGAFYVF